MTIAPVAAPPTGAHGCDDVPATAPVVSVRDAHDSETQPDTVEHAEPDDALGTEGSQEASTPKNLRKPATSPNRQE